MRRPSKQNKDTENVPPGGRAFQRIQQDRTARGLVSSRLQERQVSFLTSLFPIDVRIRRAKRSSPILLKRPSVFLHLLATAPIAARLSQTESYEYFHW